MSDFDTQADADTYFRTRFNTELTPDETFDYYNWRDEASKQMGRDLAEDETDYDLQGAWKDTGGDPYNPEKRYHASDKFKKPNHPTFSDQSVYHGTPDELHGDTWEGGKWGVKDKAARWTYTPSKHMLDHTHPTNFLKGYLQEREPDTDLLMPQEH